MRKGFFGIGIYQPRKSPNVGGLLRSAYAFNADFVFTIGTKYKRDKQDTCDATKNIPLFYYETLEEFSRNIPSGALIVPIEITSKARDLAVFTHPERCIYLLGSEVSGIPKDFTDIHTPVKINTNVCLNVSTVGAVVMYDRQSKRSSLPRSSL